MSWVAVSSLVGDRARPSHYDDLIPDVDERRNVSNQDKLLDLRKDVTLIQKLLGDYSIIVAVNNEVDDGDTQNVFFFFLYT